MDARKAQLSDFLRSCRGRLTPTKVGLPERRRRRTPGLRREDVAALAGVSVTWYTWLEQGRDIHVSAEVLDQISEALKLSTTEREFEELIDELNRDSEAFRRLWGSPEVRGYSEGVVSYEQHGGLNLEHTSYVPEGAMGFRLVVYAPYDEPTAAKLEQIMRSLGANESDL